MTVLAIRYFLTIRDMKLVGHLNTFVRDWALNRPMSFHNKYLNDV